MPSPEPNAQAGSLAVRGARELSDSRRESRSVRSISKRWQPPEGLARADVLAIIAAAATERDRLLLRVLSATGARISEVLALRPMDVQRSAHTAQPQEPQSIDQAGVPAPGTGRSTRRPSFVARQEALADAEPLFFSRKRGLFRNSGERCDCGSQRGHRCGASRGVDDAAA